MSPILVGCDGTHSSIAETPTPDRLELFPPYQERPDDTALADSMDKVDKVRASANTFGVVENAIHPSSASSNAWQGVSRERQAYILSWSKHRGIQSEKDNAAANKQTRDALATMPTPSEWEAANNIMEEFMTSGRGLSLEEIDALLIDLDQATPHNKSEDSVIAQQFISNPGSTHSFTRDHVAMTNHDTGDNAQRGTLPTLLGGISPRCGGRISPLNTNMKILTDCGEGFESSPAFRDSAIHMDDDFAQVQINLSITPGAQDVHASHQGSCHDADTDGRGVCASMQEEDSVMVDANNTLSAWARPDPGPCASETGPSLPNVWIEEDLLGLDCRDNVPYDLGSLYDLDRSRQARNNVLMLWPEQEQALFSEGHLQGLSLNGLNHDQAGLDAQNSYDYEEFGTTPGLCNSPALNDAVQHCAPAYDHKHPEIFDSFRQPTESDRAWETNGQMHADHSDLMPAVTGGIEPMKTLNQPFRFDAQNLDFMDFRHIGRQNTSDSTFVNVSEGNTPNQNAEFSNGAPNPAFSVGMTLASNVELPRTPTNARSLGRHPSQGLFTPTYGALRLTLPDITPDSPSIQAVKNKAKTKTKPKPKRGVGRPHTNDQALATAQGTGANEDVNLTEKAQSKLSNFRQIKPPKPYNFRQSPAPAVQRSITPLLTSDATIDALGLTPGNTTESQEFLTPEPPAPSSQITRRSSYSQEDDDPPSKPPSRGRSVTKKKAKRALSKMEGASTDAEEGNKPEDRERKVARRSSRLIKKTEKALDLDHKLIG